VHWDDENEIVDLVWMGLVIVSVEKALLTGEGPLTKLTLLEAASESLVQLRLKICSFCNEKITMKKERKKKKEKKHTNYCKKNELFYLFCDSCGLVVKNDLPAGENAAGRLKTEQ
jgi:hypothetical protein